MTPEQEEHERRFSERKRRAKVLDALDAVVKGANPFPQDDFVDVVGRIMSKDEDTFKARQRVRHKVAELTEKLGGDTSEQEADELILMARLARHQGADWKKAKVRHRPDKLEPVPTVPFGDDSELEARLEQRREEVAAEAAAKEARIADLERKLVGMAPATPPLPYEDEAEVDEPEPASYTPNFTIIPEQLAKYAEADEDVSAFRNRLKSYWQRFGIDEGMNFPGGGEPLTGEEKIQMRDIDMLLNSDEGRAARLHDWLFAD